MCLLRMSIMRKNWYKRKENFFTSNPHTDRPLHLCLAQLFFCCDDKIAEYQSRMYLAACCVPVSEVTGRQHLCSDNRRKLNIPRFRRSTLIGTCGLSQSPIRQSGTHCLIRCVIWPSSLNVLAQYLKTHLFAVRH